MEKLLASTPYTTLEDASRRLQEELPGTFLLRPSSDPKAVCTLSVRTDKKILHCRVYRTQDDMYYFEAPEKWRYYFPSLRELLSYYATPSNFAFPTDLIARGESGEEGIIFSLIRLVGDTDGSILVQLLQDELEDNSEPVKESYANLSMIAQGQEQSGNEVAYWNE